MPFEHIDAAVSFGRKLTYRCTPCSPNTGHHGAGDANPGECRMFTSARALIFGEDFSTDPVSKLISMVLGRFSHGHLVLDVRLLSQAGFLQPPLLSAM